MSALAVGLSVDWYAEDQSLTELCTKNLPEPLNAPMVGFLTAEGAWIDGYSGWLEAADFSKVLERVEKSPLRLATPAVRKQLEKPAAAVGAAAEKGDWQVVLTAAREAKKSTGTCPERDAIAAAEQKARAWAEGELSDIVRLAKASTDFAALRKRLGVVKQKFAGEPEAADVDVGTKALQKLILVRDVEVAGNPARDLRERHAAPFKDTRWVALFEKPEPALEQK